jgi:hypothetical protein
MTVFDAGARPMASVFQAKPDMERYMHVQPQVPLNEKNPPKAADAAPSTPIRGQ